MELKIDSEKVLQLAEKCPQWKDGLKELFPEVFIEKPIFDMKPTDFRIDHSGQYKDGIFFESKYCCYWIVKKGTIPNHDHKVIPLRSNSVDLIIET